MSILIFAHKCGASLNVTGVRRNCCRIVVQNEKYDDWTLVLIKLKILFHDYNETVLNFHALPGVKLPRGHNSAASEGNVLEVLNMGLNVFEKHTTDRNFERTGQMSIVITPSTGVLQVDRELLTLTKQKSIDYGIGNDLVFMGEQPLHVVPLFILHNKSGGEPVDYAIPNWLNYSYYTSKWANPNVFVPRIRIPEKVLQAIQKKSFFSSSEEAGTDHREFVEDFLFTTRQSTAKKTRSKGRTDRRLSESAAVSVVSHEMPTEMKMVPERSDERRNLLLSASLETANRKWANSIRQQRVPKIVSFHAKVRNRSGNVFVVKSQFTKIGVPLV